MKIIHICLSGGFTENFTYQENYLTKYQALAGHDVTIVTTQYCWHKDQWGPCDDRDYVNDYGVRVIRLPYKGNMPYKYNCYFGRFEGLQKTLNDLDPDFIFIHNLQFVDLKVITLYKKQHNHIHVVADSHTDFSNSATNWISKNIIHKIHWRKGAIKAEPYIEKFYGVLPARVDFLSDVYKLPKEKCGLLVMGADDEYVEKYSSPDSCSNLKKKYNLRTDDFVIVTGGKIDSFKRQTLLLMEAVRDINDPHVKLLVFGSIQDDIRVEFDDLCDGTLVQYLGWADAEQSYMYFSLADLVVFPGRHSVYWEQAAGQGKPMICKYWDGTTHVDLGGNVEFLYKDSIEEIRQAIQNLVTADGESTDKYYSMKKCAAEKGPDVFSYKKIAERSIECC